MQTAYFPFEFSTNVKINTKIESIINVSSFGIRRFVIQSLWTIWGWHLIFENILTFQQAFKSDTKSEKTIKGERERNELRD